MKKNISLFIMLLSSWVITGCVQVPPEQKQNNNQLAISSVRDSPVSYPQGSLFALSPKYVKETSLKAEQTQVIYHLYNNAIVSDLIKNGYVTGKAIQQAAFYVGFGVALSNDLSDKKISDKFGITPGLSEKSGLKKGSLLIYIEDAVTGQRVWRGIAQGFANTDLTPAQRHQRAAKIVANVMKQFYQTN
ncbi:DUF4136 domain-containing protein [Candidatus Colwellia aromaticivorans]|uniref:DUF4136 domain-containing protein n=1 Tax=Candidatus Colwellia aromaticivorans TaxID=2267621 RepID=UPI000DF1EB9A|nr:DUF4136 domain-containing protein [Candidatus Colwellia aromaticivorans]